MTMNTLRIEWKNKEARGYVDLLDLSRFAHDVADSKIKHFFQKPRGGVYTAICRLHVDGNIATLKYEAGDNIQHDLYLGTVRIVFEDGSRKRVQAVLWAEDGSENFEALLPPPEITYGERAEAQEEIARLIRLGKIASRLEQSAFSAKLRQAYHGRCAVTGCVTPEALEAAHIHVVKGKDLNHARNGILLRGDIHALFDAGLIALTEDGCKIEVTGRLKGDVTYQFLGGVDVYRPEGCAPSLENIRSHRQRFKFN